MKSYEFTIDAPLMGAVRTTQKQKFIDPRYAKYSQYKNRVRFLGNAAGIPPEIHSDQSIGIFILATWKNAQRIDADNVIKGILDALWSNDRRVVNITYRGEEFGLIEAAFVTVEVHKRKTVKQKRK